MRGFETFAILLALGAAALAACGKGAGTGGGSSGEITCDPGENIFCRCPGGEAGTKTCKPDGHSFEACVTRDGPCPAIPSTTASSGASSSSGGGAGGMGTGGMGTGGGMPGGYLDACTQDADCQGMKCRYGYCTMDCAKYDACTLGVGECIQFAGEQICMPVCGVTADCLDAYGSPSACGYVAAVDGTPVTTCCDWQDKLKVPPEGTNCMDDVACNLGNEGVQSVCASDACTKGCHTATDCPTSTTCSSTGSTPGSCNPQTVPGDTCPGIPVMVATGTDVTLTGNTAAAGAHYKGTGACATSASTKDVVYAVTPAQSGTLYVTLDPAYDGQIYARTGACTTGMQIGCSETGGSGATEIMSFPVTAGTKVSVFADGNSGSAGSYTIQFHLGP